MRLPLIVGFSLMGSVGAIALAGSFLLFPDKTRRLLIGDAFHNFADGVIIAATFVVSVPLGIATSLSVIAHEIPQEVGDLAILLDSGYARNRALAYNILSSLSTLPGAVLAYLALAEVQRATPYIMALSAASFIYIAIADLVPGLHHFTGIRSGLRQSALMLAGIGTIALFHFGR